MADEYTEAEIAVLRAYSKGRISRRDAVRSLGFRDDTGLLVALGDVDLPMPFPPEDEVERQAAFFVDLWRLP